MVYDPMYDTNNVVIIDEAQNITQSGLDMTLKLLEIERERTYFILCTMNQKAFGKAIRSRGQVYRFEKLTVEEIGETLLDILDSEDPQERLPDEFAAEGIPAIAEAAEGSMREAISVAERAVNSKLWTREAIEREFGVVGERKSFSILLELLGREKMFFEHRREIDSKAFFYYGWKVVNETGIRVGNVGEEE